MGSHEQCHVQVRQSIAVPKDFGTMCYQHLHTIQLPMDDGNVQGSQTAKSYKGNSLTPIALGTFQIVLERTLVSSCHAHTQAPALK